MKQCLFFTLLLFSISTFALPVYWTDWTSSSNSYSAVGQIVIGSTTIGVQFSSTSAYNFIQTSGGTNYWTGAAYTNGSVSNAPSNSDLISLYTGGTITITFSQAVQDPVFALASWNSNSLNFGIPIVVDSTGSGYFGSGSFSYINGNTGVAGSGEVHGIIRLTGMFTSVTFTHTSENWHGMTLGVFAVPEMNSLSLLVIACIALFARKR
ncbi:MAG: hypothetical protein HUU50_13500 [Candidatus Brocadiae bacterium]|nr:hypothetical protein [Candidatus Brocadiia bacterium]